MHRVRAGAVAALVCGLALACTACDGDAAAGGEGDATTAADAGQGIDTGGAGDAGTPQDTPTAGDAAADAAVDASADAGPADVAPDVGLPACDPPLALSPTDAQVLPYGLLILQPSGGTGAYRFELTADGSGAVVNALTGAYLSGATPGSSDGVTLTDLGCEGQALTNVEVVPHLTVAPASAIVPPATAFSYAVEGGSGSVTFALIFDGSGGTVTPDGDYSAGSQGIDRLRVTDSVTGEFVDVDVTVQPGAVLTPAPERVFLAVGEALAPAVGGGSGHVEVAPAEPAIATVSEDGGALVGVSEGTTTVVVTDAFSGQTTALTATVVAPREAPTIRFGDLSGWSRVATSDLDGDGYVDAVLGLGEADVAALDSGAIYVYRGTAAGLEPAPAQVISGQARRDNLGRGLAVTDIDGDGRADLLAGAQNADVGSANNGAAYLYPGLEGGRFAAEPAHVFFGVVSYDAFGHSVAACDFNGDGHVDVAFGAINAENRDLDPRPNNQGAIHVYLGREDGFLQSPDMVIWGKSLDAGGAFVDDDEIHLGYTLATGDHDGDGLCDLAAHAEDYRTTPSRSADGAVFVYRGVAAEGEDPGGLALLAARIVRGSEDGDPTSRLGRRLALGDVDGDGRDDLLVGQWDSDIGNGTASGAARLFLGRDLDGPATSYDEAVDADWTLVGDNSYDYVGWDVAIADADGSPPLDLVVAAVNDELPDLPGGAGIVAVYAGVDGGLPDLATPWAVSGPEGSTRFGDGVGVLAPGADGPRLLVHAGRDDALGYEVGRPYHVSADGALAPLEMPGEGAGMQLGWTVAVVGDVTGDGRPDLVAGAPEAADETYGVDAGLAFLYEGTDDGFTLAPSLIVRGFLAHSGSDRFGTAVSRAGDFDGDGVPDFAALSRYEDVPSSFDAAEVDADASCTGSSNNPGAAWVFRGSASGLPATEPAFVFFGDQAGQPLEQLAGGFDFDGDGYDDLVVGSRSWDFPGASNQGGFGVILGRPAPPDGRVAASCGSDWVFGGFEGTGYLGWDVAPVGDLDGDGCDDIAASGYLLDLGGSSNQGGVLVVFGFGPTCTAQVARGALLAPQDSGGANAGYGIAGGADADGDGLPDLVVGAVNLTVGGNATGGAWLIPGSYLASLPREPLTSGASPAEVHPFVPSGATGTFRLSGVDAGERAGTAVALLPGAGEGGRALVAVGAPFGGQAGQALSGGVTLFAATTGDGLDPAPVAIFAGEASRPGGRLGEALDGALLGDGTPVLIVGGPDGSSVGLDQGSVYALPW